METTRIPKPSNLRLPKPILSSTKLTSTLAKSTRTLNVIPESKVAATAQPSTASIAGRSALAPLPPRSHALRRRSKSMEDFGAIASRSRHGLGRAAAGGPQAPVASRMGLKRAADVKSVKSSESQVVRPKISKVAKVPDWDYKARFAILTDKHKILQDSCKINEKKLADLSNLETQLTVLTHENKSLQKTVDTVNEIKSANARLTSNNAELQVETEELKSKLTSLTDERNNLLISQKTNADKIDALTIEKNDLAAKLTDLTAMYETQTNNLEELTNKHGKLRFEFDSIQKESEILEDNLTAVRADNHHLIEQVDRLKRDLIENERLRRALHNTVQDLKGNIRVFCRVRPPVNEDESNRNLCNINFVDDTTLDIRKSRESVSTISGKVNEFRSEFTFDKVFPPNSNQELVFEELAMLVQSALDGYNVCVFAYGQTGSGKTYTMQGDNSSTKNLGMIPRTIDLTFERIAKLEDCGWKYVVEASFLEIYNENIRDLLNPNANLNYEIRFNEGKGIIVMNLKIEAIQSAQALKDLMEESHRNRAVAATDFNEHSSRSHAITKIYLRGTHEDGSVYSGSLNLVDLAGSESAKTSANERLIETKNINRSLSALGNVMLALHNNDPHTPFRDSKLTYLLQSCLSGNSKTLMFVNISPFDECFGESISSLRFASKVKEVKITSKKNKSYK